MKPREAVGIVLETDQGGPLSWLGTSIVPHFWEGNRTFGALGAGQPAPEIDYVSLDGWDGYAASRRRITQGWVDAAVRNAVNTRITKDAITGLRHDAGIPRPHDGLLRDPGRGTRLVAKDQRF